MNVVRLARPGLLIAAPSLWLMSASPPMWRDVDAYVQTVYPPSSNTILLHGPLYCTISRIPLWFGYVLSSGRPAVSLDHFIYHSELTDAGVFILILSQHLALWCAALYLITAISRNLIVRVLLAGLFATQPLFYTFAHCVGSETLSLILILVLAGKGLRLMLRLPDVKPRHWIAFTVLLCCCILTRHINRVLIAVVPITITLLWLQKLRPHAGHIKTPPSQAQYARALTMSVVAGAAALAWAITIVHLLC